MTNILTVLILLTILGQIQNKILISKPKSYSYDINGQTLPLSGIKFNFFVAENLDQQKNLRTDKINNEKYINIEKISLEKSQHYLDFAINFTNTHFNPNKNGQPITIEVILEKYDQPKDLIDLQPENFEIMVDSEYNSQFLCVGYVSFIRAFQTFMNLINDDGTIDNIPIQIGDSPSYDYRGLMIDSSRHFQPLQVIQRTIRGMLLAKLNVLHWHITDHESFPPVIETEPELSLFGAYDQSEIYTKQQIHGIIVIPEFDSPGHTQSWVQSPKYQKLNACPEILLDGQLDPTMDETYDLVKAVFSEAQKIFPSNYFHIGGDEVSKACYDSRPSIMEFMKAHNISDYIELQHYYNEKINDFIDKQKYRMFWFDADTKNLKYPNNSIIQFWGLSDQYQLLENYTENIVLSPYDSLYFDLGTGGWRGNGYGSFTTWNKVYQFMPQKSRLGKRLLGAECTLWAEMINYESLDWKIWPRASALGLRLWNEDENLKMDDLVANLVQTNKMLIKTGISPGPVTKEYCERDPKRCFKDTMTEEELAKLIAY